MEKSHFEQALLWLKAAEDIGKMENKEAFAVGVAMAIHAIIKANDALTMKFIGITARRHDEARKLFEDLIKKGSVPAQFAGYNNIIQDAINQKARAEYRVSYFSKSDYEEMKRKAEKFIGMVKGIV